MALIPDLVLVIGAMILVVAAALRPDSASHQRAVGWGSIIVTLLALAAVIYFLINGYRAGAGPIAVDNYRWMVDIVILLGTMLTVMLAMDDNDREFITAPETHVLVLLASSGMMRCFTSGSSQWSTRRGPTAIPGEAGIPMSFRSTNALRICWR